MDRELNSALMDIDDPEFWEAYEQFMREPVEEGECIASLASMKEFVEGEENA